MNNYTEDIKAYNEKLIDKNRKKLKPLVLARLNDKLLEINDSEVEEMLQRITRLLKDISQGSVEDIKLYKKTFQSLKKLVRKKYDLIEEGTLQGEYMAMGVALGIAFGAAFSAIQVGLIGVGLPIGVAVGAGLGKQKEEEAKKKGKIY